MSQGTDAGLAEIIAQFGAGGGGAVALEAPPDPVTGQPGDGIAFGFAAVVGALAANTEAIRGAERRRRQMAAEIMSGPLPVFAFAGSAMPYVQPSQNWGPRRGVNWAIQTLTVAGLGTSDVATVYRANSVNDMVPGNGRYSFTVSVAGAVATWHPGRTGLVLRGDDDPVLGFGGTSSSAEITIGGEVIIVSDAQLPYFLL